MCISRAYATDRSRGEEYKSHRSILYQARGIFFFSPFLVFPCQSYYFFFGIFVSLNCFPFSVPLLSFVFFPFFFIFSLSRGARRFGWHAPNCPPTHPEGPQKKVVFLCYPSKLEGPPPTTSELIAPCITHYCRSRRHYAVRSCSCGL